MFIFLSQVVMAEPTSFALSEKNGDMFVKVYKADTYGAALAHNHAIGATAWKGNVRIDADDLSTCTFSFNVPVNQLEADGEKYRKLAGIASEGQPSESERTDIKANMLAENQLHGDKYKTISFESSSCAKESIKGKFTLRGKTQDITIPVKMEVGEKLSLKGQFDILSTDYGFEPYSIMFGQIANQPKMTIVFDIKSK